MRIEINYNDSIPLEVKNFTTLYFELCLFGIARSIVEAIQMTDEELLEKYPAWTITVEADKNNFPDIQVTKRKMN